MKTYLKTVSEIMKQKVSFLPVLLLGISMQTFLLTPYASAQVLAINFSTDGNWSTPGNWTGGTLPWANAAGNTSVDMTFAANVTINSAQVWTGSQFGVNEGQPFVFRRITVSGGRTLTVEAGGLLEFTGDDRILSNSTGSSIVMTGGIIRSTTARTGFSLGGSHAGITLSGNSTIDISATNPGYNPGIDFGDSSVISGPLHLIGSNVTLSVKNISFRAAVGSYFPKFRFTLDAGGASAISVTNQFDLTANYNTISLQLYLQDGLEDAPDTITLFNLANGSLGAFDEVVTSRGTFAATEGTIIEIASVADSSKYLSYELTYKLNGNNIGLIVVPEPSIVALFGLGLIAILYRRKRC